MESSDGREIPDKGRKVFWPLAPWIVCRCEVKGRHSSINYLRGNTACVCVFTCQQGSPL